MNPMDGASSISKSSFFDRVSTKVLDTVSKMPSGEKVAKGLEKAGTLAVKAGAVAALAPFAVASVAVGGVLMAGTGAATLIALPFLSAGASMKAHNQTGS